MNPQQEALRAGAELELTKAAFNEIRTRLLAEIMDAKSAEEAWQAVLSMRACNSVTSSLQSYLDTEKLDAHHEENTDE